MSSDGPPLRAEVTTSRVCLDLVEVNTFTNSGMRAPAIVPQETMAASCHQRCPPSRFRSMRKLVTKVKAMDRIEVSHTSAERGASKFIEAELPNFRVAMMSLPWYAAADATTMTIRTVKIQTRRRAWVKASGTARVRNVTRATPVTP